MVDEQRIGRRRWWRAGRLPLLGSAAGGGVVSGALVDRNSATAVLAGAELLSQGAAVRGARRLDVLERDRFAGVLGTDRAAEEPVAVEDADLREVARVVLDSCIRGISEESEPVTELSAGTVTTCAA